jgi:predicted MFS family arabinose efflux permease
MIGYLLFAAIHVPVAYYAAAVVIGLGNGHMCPAYQNMFINMAPNSQRGTANSTFLTSWDVGLGLGVLLGGTIAERFSYHSAFWTAFGVNAVGVAAYYLLVRAHFLRYKLR